MDQDIGRVPRKANLKKETQKKTPWKHSILSCVVAVKYFLEIEQLHTKPAASVAHSTALHGALGKLNIEKMLWKISC